MSKFLRILVRIILIIFIVAGLALVVPPFFGINTQVVDETESSNMAVGTVAYVQTVSPDSIQSGDSILISGEDTLNRYTVDSYDEESGTISGKLSASSDSEELNVSGDVRKIVFTVPYLGYLALATESRTGLLMLGGCVLIVIILFILSVVLGNAEEEEDEADQDTEYFESLKKVKDGSADRKKDEDVGELPEEEKEKLPVEGEGEEFIRNLKGAVSGNDIPEVTSETAGEILDATSDFRNKSNKANTAADTAAVLSAAKPDPVASESLPEMQKALEAALEVQQIDFTSGIRVGDTMAAMNSDETGGGTKTSGNEIELAIPVKSLDELMEDARKKGYTPKVREDITTGVKLVDYSDTL